MKLLYTRRQVKNLITQNEDLKTKIQEIEGIFEIVGELRTILEVENDKSILEKARQVIQERREFYEKLKN